MTARPGMAGAVLLMRTRQIVTNHGVASGVGASVVVITGGIVAAAALTNPGGAEHVRRPAIAGGVPDPVRHPARTAGSPTATTAPARHPTAPVLVATRAPAFSGHP